MLNIYIHIYIYVYVYMYVYIYIYIYVEPVVKRDFLLYFVFFFRCGAGYEHQLGLRFAF